MKKFTIRTFSLILVLSMVFSLVPMAHAYSKVSDWAKESVETMDDLGLIPSTLKNTDLTQGITRLDMCRIAVNTYEELTDNTIPLPGYQAFKDTTDEAATQAYVVGLVNGMGDGTFNPNGKLSRVEFFCFVYNLLQAVGYPVSPSDYADLSSFSDASDLPSWAEKHTKVAVGLDIVQGTGNALSFDTTTTAEQAITMFCRAYTQASDAKLNPPAIEIPEPLYPSVRFYDASSWALKDYLEPMYALGLIPDDIAYKSMTKPMTRAEMCKIAMQTYKMGTVDSPFSDTKDNDIALALFLGIVNGYEDGTFRPDNAIQRQELFQITVNLLNALFYPYNDDPTIDLGEYADSAELQSYALPTTRLLVGLEIVWGDENKNLSPTASIVREEALTIFYRAYKFVTELPSADETPDDDRTDENKTLAEKVVELALSYKGYPYVYGGASPSGFDCSGLVYYCYNQSGYKLKYRSSRDQWNVSSTVIPKNELLVGDIVFFSNNGSASGIYHVGLYIGNNKIIHASTPSTGVIISDLSEAYYVRNYFGAKRVIN